MRKLGYRCSAAGHGRRDADRIRVHPAGR
jgi:hypothetical protein